MIKLSRFTKYPHLYKVGVAEINYYDLTLYCDVNICADGSGLWIRMPQALTRANTPYNCATWENKDKSDEFQKAVLEQLKEQYPEIFDIPSKDALKRAIKEKKLEIRKRQQVKHEAKKIVETNPAIPVGKARNQSRFTMK